MKEEIKKMDQVVADSSTFIKRMKDKDPQQIALEKAISDFWDTSDVLQESSPVKIASLLYIFTPGSVPQYGID